MSLEKYQPTKIETTKAEEITSLSPTQRKLTDERESKLKETGKNFVIRWEVPNAEEKEKYPYSYQTLCLSGMVVDGRIISLRQVLKGEISYGNDDAYSGSIRRPNSKEWEPIPDNVARQLFGKYKEGVYLHTENDEEKLNEHIEKARQEIVDISKPVKLNSDNEIKDVMPEDRHNAWDGLL